MLQTTNQLLKCPLRAGICNLGSAGKHLGIELFCGQWRTRVRIWDSKQFTWEHHWQYIHVIRQHIFHWQTIIGTIYKTIRNSQGTRGCTWMYPLVNQPSYGKSPFLMGISMYITYKWPFWIAGWWFEPLWKIWKSIGMMTFPIYGKIKNKKWQPNRQPDSYVEYCWITGGLIKVINKNQPRSPDCRDFQQRCHAPASQGFTMFHLPRRRLLDGQVKQPMDRHGFHASEHAVVSSEIYRNMVFQHHVCKNECSFFLYFG